MSNFASTLLRIIAILFFLFVLLLGVSFSSLNSDPVSVNYYLGSITLPLSAVVVSALALGVLAAFLVSFTSFLALRVRIANLRRDVRRRDQEITALRRPSVGTAA